MTLKSALVCLVLVCAPQMALCAQKEWKDFALPPAVETRQEISSVPAGWTALNEAVPNHVAGITVFDGRPEQRASLVPGKEERQKARNRLVLTWRLTPSSDEGTWVSFSYTSTSVVLARPLPKGTTGLRVTYDTAVTVCGLHEIVRIEYR